LAFPRPRRKRPQTVRVVALPVRDRPTTARDAFARHGRPGRGTRLFELGATRVDDPSRGLDPLPSPGDARSVCRDDQSRATGVTPTARLRTRVEMTPPTAPQGRSSRWHASLRISEIFARADRASARLLRRPRRGRGPVGDRPPRVRQPAHRRAG